VLVQSTHACHAIIIKFFYTEDEHFDESAEAEKGMVLNG